MKEVLNSVTSKADSYVVVFLFLFILFVVFAGLFYYLYWARKKGEIWDSDTLEGASSFSVKIKRDEDPRGFLQAWWFNFSLIVGMVLLTVWILFF